ncbi:MAG: YihY/virulence factor BrkB family protein [Xenococcaceae cyanobacterium]
METARFFRFFRHLNWVTLRKTISRAVKRRLMGLSAEMAYHAMLALFPALLAILTAIGLFEESVKSTLGKLAIRFEDIVPEQVWTLLFNFVQGIKVTNSSWFSISFVAAIWIFSGVLSAAMDALDQIHQVPPEQKRPFWKAKLVSLVLTIGTIILLIIASFLVLLGDLIVKLAVDQNWGSVLLIVWQIISGLVILAIIATALTLIYQIHQVPTNKKRMLWKAKYIFLIIIVGTILLRVIDSFLILLRDLIESPEINQDVISVLLSVWRLLSWPVALGIVATAFAFVYRFGVSRSLQGTPILPGAILAALSWAGLSALFRLYVSNFGQYNKVYGAVGAVIVLMLWLYMSSFVMLLGDQLNATVGEAMNNEQ